MIIFSYEDDMGRLEAEFRDSLLMPMPRGNMNERDHRTEQIPGGYETYHKDNRAQSGKRVGKDGQPVDFQYVFVTISYVLYLNYSYSLIICAYFVQKNILWKFQNLHARVFDIFGIM